MQIGRNIILFFCGLIIVVSSSAWNLESPRRSIVLISSSDGIEEQQGGGIILGRDGDYVYIITPYHVIKPFYTEIPDSILVQFFGNYFKYPAAIATFSEEMDLAILQVSTIHQNLSNKVSFKPIRVARSQKLKVRDALTIISHPLGEDWSMSYQNQLKETTYGADINRFSFTNVGIYAGSSGAGIFNQNGLLLGMLQQTDAVAAIGVHSHALIAFAAENDIPTNLLTYKKSGPNNDFLPQIAVVHAELLSPTKIYSSAQPINFYFQAKYLNGKKALEKVNASLTLPDQTVTVGNEVLEFKDWKKNEIKHGKLGFFIQPSYEKDVITVVLNITYRGDTMNQVTQTLSLSGKSLTTTKKKNANVKSYALLFGITKYEKLKKLKNPGKDAKTLANDLEKIYGFQPEIVLNPNRKND